MATTARADEYRSRAGAIAQALDASGQRAENVLGILRRLPDLAPLRKDLFQAGRALGTTTVNALSARAVRAFTVATRLLGRAFGQHHDRGFGRDDDGLGR